MISKFCFRFKGKELELEIEECKTFFQKFRGLMFRKDGKALLFKFEKPTRQAIHSFFCKPFVAIWFDGNEIVDGEFIKPWKFSVKPKGRFNKLLEIPFGNPLFKEFSDGRKV